MEEGGKEGAVGVLSTRDVQAPSLRNPLLEIAFLCCARMKISSNNCNDHVRGII